MSNLNYYYAEDCRFDSFFGWLRATQHCVCNKWLPTCLRLQSSVNLQSYSNLQSKNWTKSCSNMQSQHWTESCEEVQKKIINSNPNLFKQTMITSKSINWNVERFKSKYMFISGHFHVLGVPKPHFQCNANREVATTSPRFCNEPCLLHALFVQVVPGTTFTSWSKHHFAVIGKAEQQVRKASYCGTKCGGLEMAPHENKWSPLDGAHEKQFSVIVTTSELS